MDRVTACDVPEGSLLAEFGGPGDYRDCFCRVVPGTVSLPAFIERFYCSMAFRPERLVLGLMRRGASNADARALASGETDRIAVWEVVERRSTRLPGLVAEHGERPASRKPDRAPAGPKGRGNRSADALRNTETPSEAKTNGLDEILLESKGTGTASWLAVEPVGDAHEAAVRIMGRRPGPIRLALHAAPAPDLFADAAGRGVGQRMRLFPVTPAKAGVQPTSRQESTVCLSANLI